MSKQATGTEERDMLEGVNASYRVWSLPSAALMKIAVWPSCPVMSSEVVQLTLPGTEFAVVPISSSTHRSNS